MSKEYLQLIDAHELQHEPTLRLAPDVEAVTFL